MKARKIVTTIAVVLIIFILILISFLGIYKQQGYKISNIVKPYLLGMDFEGKRVINLKVDDTVNSKTIYDKDGNKVEEQEGVEYTQEEGYTIVEDRVNGQDKLITKNYKLSKQIIVNRLNGLKTPEYTIRQNQNDGTITIEIPENADSDYITSYIGQVGKFELLDDETEEVLMDNSYISHVQIAYSSETDGTSVYLQIKFNKEGAKKLEEISKIYTQVERETSEEQGTTTETKNVRIEFDGTTYMKTYFGDTMTNGILNISFGSSSDTSEIKENQKKAEAMGKILKIGIMPINYKSSTQTINSTIYPEQNNTGMYIISGCILIALLYFIIKFKTKGLLAALLQIGYIASLLLILRFTNVVITLEGIIGIIISVILNYMLLYKMFYKSKTEDSIQLIIKETFVEFTLICIPVIIASIVFTPFTLLNIGSLGMTMFWGIIVIYLYNIIFTSLIILNTKQCKDGGKNIEK